ncbi:hypothetical protein [Novosphingobium resinovorum]|uniref:hypothetical protein n=1 Tax=Novosphingobium resinovorum TaxID=158500 RepID=UPI003D2B6C94
MAPLHQQARAEYYLASGSPKIQLNDLQTWLSQGTELPGADQHQPPRAQARRCRPPLAPSRTELRAPADQSPSGVRPSSIDDGTMPAGIANGINDRIKNDDPMGARLLLDGIDANLSPSSQAEWRQRWRGASTSRTQDANAYQMAQIAALGQGPWVGEAWWTAGLAAWRLGDCDGAADAFAKAARSSRQCRTDRRLALLEQPIAGAPAASPSRRAPRCALPPRATRRYTGCWPPSSSASSCRAARRR